MEKPTGNLTASASQKRGRRKLLVRYSFLLPAQLRDTNDRTLDVAHA